MCSIGVSNTGKSLKTSNKSSINKLHFKFEIILTFSFLVLAKNILLLLKIFATLKYQVFLQVQVEKIQF